MLLIAEYAQDRQKLIREYAEEGFCLHVTQKYGKLSKLDYNRYLFVLIQLSRLLRRPLAADSLRELCDNPLDDIHTVTAALMNNIPPDLVTKELRRQAKQFNFMELYGSFKGKQ